MKDMIQIIKCNIVIEAEVEVRVRKVDEKNAWLIVTATKGVWNAIESTKLSLPAQIEDVHEKTERTIMTALKMLKEAIANTPRDLGLEMAVSFKEKKGKKPHGHQKSRR